MFKEYSYGPFKQQIRDLLRERYKIKDRVRLHLKKIDYHNEKIILLDENLAEVEKKLNWYLEKAGNDIDEKCK